MGVSSDSLRTIALEVLRYQIRQNILIGFGRSHRSVASSPPQSEQVGLTDIGEPQDVSLTAFRAGDRNQAGGP